MSIASRIQEIETHIGDVYDTINYSYDTTGVNKNIINIPKYLKKGYIDIINNGIDTLYNNFPKVSGIGSNLSLTPTYEAPMKLNEIQGDTLQDGTPTPNTPVEIQSVTGLQNIEVCGKNLINSVAKSGNRLFFNGGTDAGVGTFKAGTYTISYTSQNTITTYIKNTDGTQTNLGTDKEITFTSNKDFDLWLYRSGITIEEVSNIQLEQGSTATDYEPYKSNTYEVNLGKNLFDINGTFTGNLIKYNNGFQLIKNSTNRTINYLPSSPIPKGTYTLSYEIVSSTLSDVNKLLIQFFNASNTNILTKTLSSTGSLNCILTEDVTKIYFYISNSEETDTQITFDNIQLEKGSQATSFSPYFTPIELNKIGDYQDSIKKSTGKNLFDEEYELGTINYNTGELEDSTTIIRTKNYQTIKPSTSYTIKVPDEVNGIILYYYNNGTYVATTQPTVPSTKVITFTTNANANQVKWRFNSNYTTLNNQTMLNEGTTTLPYEPYGKVWYVEKNIGKVVLDGSETQWARWFSTPGVYSCSNLIQTINNATAINCISNYYSNTYSRAYVRDNLETIDNNIATNGGELIIANKSYTTLSDFKNWLSTHNTTVYTILATPTYTEITNTELIEDLETLYTAKSQEGTTNISITSEDLEMILNVSALKGDA